MYFQTYHLWMIACEARDRAKAAARANPEVLVPDATVALIFSAVSTESFINELANLVRLRKDGPDGPFLSRQLADFADTLVQAERDHVPLTDKYLLGSEKLGRKFDKGKPPFQDFKLLVKLRNDHVHLHPWYDAWLRDPTGAPPRDAPKHVQTLLRRKDLTRKLRPKTNMAWVNRLQTPEMAAWVCDTAKAIIQAVLALIPDDPVHDPTAINFKFWFH
jgi:hypothetical protein